MLMLMLCYTYVHTVYDITRNVHHRFQKCCFLKGPLSQMTIDNVKKRSEPSSVMTVNCVCWRRMLESTCTMSRSFLGWTTLLNLFMFMSLKFAVSGVFNNKLIKGKVLRKHSLHEKTAASVLLKLFISGNEWCQNTLFTVILHRSLNYCLQHILINWFFDNSLILPSCLGENLLILEARSDPFSKSFYLLDKLTLVLFTFPRVNIGQIN